MEPKLIITIVMILALIYFRFGSGSRLLKKKSYHHIDPTAAHDDPNWIPIEIDEYDKHIFIQLRANENAVDEIFRTVENEFPQMEVEVAAIDGWIQIHVIHSDFSDFHKLISSCTIKNGTNAIGYCLHHSTKSNDYIAKLDFEEGNEHLVGSFQTNQNFGIYLPKSGSHPKGNMSKSPVKEIDFQHEVNQIPVFDLNC